MTKGTEHKYTNRLVHEKSPYLLQHAHNPVDWYPWGKEAFEKAKAEDKPIFLSIGYSTCHWCHVMERESFEDPHVAALLNETFVNIKVDREERPDIDGLYMAVCQMLTGSGGWPLTIIMTPDKQPFFAATYIPRSSRFGRSGMLEVIPRIREMWANQRNRLLRVTEELRSALITSSDAAPGDELGERVLEMAFEGLSSRFDEEQGGFADAPKFPRPHNLTFLLRYWYRTKNTRALHMVETTLQAMRSGGIFDHVGLGFHRYSTDSQWLLPHFEKMLYDQALLAIAYTEAFQATQKTEYRQTVEEILTNVLRDMKDPAGGFYSAEDADSEGVEGKFYVWSEQEIRRALSQNDADLFIKVFNIMEEGNFVEEATRHRTRTNIPHLRKPYAEIAIALELPEKELRKRLERIRLKLFTIRERRVHPQKDDKILVDWNGLMIAALAKAGRILSEPKYIEAATQTVKFIFDKLCDEEGRLYHRYREGEAAIPAFLDDYAFLIWGLIELYESTFEPQFLQSALTLNEELLQRFWDSGSGGFYFVADDAEALIVRKKEVYDGAIPSGNSIAMLNLLRLSRITGNPDFEAKAAQIGQVFSGTVLQAPIGFTQLIIAVDFALGPSYEIVITGNPGARDTRAMIDALRSKFLPRKVVLLRPIYEGAREIIHLAPFIKDYGELDGKTTVYVCVDQQCNLPTTDISEMLKLLD